MANDFWVEFTEDGERKRERAQIGNFDGNVKQAQATITRIWAGALPGRTDVTVTGVAGGGRVERVSTGDQRSTPQGDAAIIAKQLKKSGDAANV